MSKKRQTAVEWLEAKAKEFAIDLDLLSYFEKAKEMEKEQIVDAIVQHQIKHHDLWSEKGILQAVKQAEQYYTETYNNCKTN
jgi:hypothetical protein